MTAYLRCCMTETPLSESPQRPWLPYAVLVLILLASLSLNFINLGHPAVKDLDEAYHAIVARSMIDDPLRPTLYATPYLPYDYRNWQGNHVWLHKPPVSLWQIAASLSTFGESNFTLRLPSALLATAAVALTFFIGRTLVNSVAGLVAATLQALSPAILRLVHGRVFSDHVDVAMLFWCELSLWLLVRAATSGKLFDAILVGIAQAIAWMTKSYPAGFITVVAASLVLAGWRWRSSLCFTLRQFLAMLIATILAAAPWTIWCLIHFRQEFLFEQFHVFSHLATNVENFAAPWDRLLADYLQRGLLEWYALAIVAVFLLSFDAVRSRDAKRLLIATWAWAVLLPHLSAASKTPTATLIGWPAAWLAIGTMASDAIRGRSFAIGATLAAAVLLIVWPQMPHESVMGYGDGYRFGSIALSHWQIFASAIAISAAGLLYESRGVPTSDPAPDPASTSGPRTVRLSWLLVVLFAYPLARDARLSIATSRDVPRDAVAFPQLGHFVRAKSPPNAVFLVDVQQRGEAVIAMWWLNRACYPLREETLADDVATIAANGGEPFILSRRDRPEPELRGVVGEARIFVPAIPARR